METGISLNHGFSTDMSDSGLGEDSPSSLVHMDRKNLSALDRTELMSGLTNIDTDSPITDNQVSSMSTDSLCENGSRQLDSVTPSFPAGVGGLEESIKELEQEQRGGVGSVEAVDQCGGRTSVDQLSEHLSLLSTEHDLSQLDEDLLSYSPTMHSSRQSLLSSSSRSSKENLSQSSARSRIPLIPPSSPAKTRQGRNKFELKPPNTLPRPRILRERQEDKCISQRPSSASARQSSRLSPVVTSRPATATSRNNTITSPATSRINTSKSPVMPTRGSPAASSRTPRGISDSRSPSSFSNSRSPSGSAQTRSPAISTESSPRITKNRFSGMSNNRSPDIASPRSPGMSKSRSPGIGSPRCPGMANSISPGISSPRSPGMNIRSPGISNSRSTSFGSRGSPISGSPRSESPESISPSCRYHRSQSSPARKRQKKVDMGKPVEIWQIQQTLKRGEFIEGVLNVGSKKRTDSFICAPVNLGRSSGHLDWG